MGDRKKKKNHLVRQYNHHQISSFNLASCLRPPPTPTPTPPPALADVVVVVDKSKSWLPFLCRFTPRSSTPQLAKSSSFTSSASSSNSQLLKSDTVDADWDTIVDKGPVSPEVGCMGQVRRPDQNKRLVSAHFSRMLYLSAAKTSAKVEDYCSSSSSSSSSRQEEYVAETMDPPLPVPKRGTDGVDAKVDSLWRRRRGGTDGGLESLNVQQLKMQQAQLHLHLGFGCTRGLEA